MTNQTYASKSTALRGAKRAGMNSETTRVYKNAAGRFQAIDITLNKQEYAIAYELVKSCMDGMGGTRPASLESDTYTWVDHTVIMAAFPELSEAQAKGYFGALTTKRLICVDADGAYISDDLWMWMDPEWERGYETVNFKLATDPDESLTPPSVAMLHESEIPRPVNFVHAWLGENYGKQGRAASIRMLVALGIATHTAKTQYQIFHANRKAK